MKLKCIIIDDEPIARKLIEEFIGDIDFLELVGFVLPNEQLQILFKMVG